MTEPNAFPWSGVSVLAAVTVSILSAVVFVLLDFRGYSTDIPAFGTVISALAGGAVLWRRHPRTWWLVVMFYVPVMAVLLVVGAVIVLGRLGYPFET
ncbi:MAG: hypothetical protein Q7R30_03070 [Acidobacteriota bacterium]|nr:hypothetical protein [Acidobacteriota bacterium]